MASPESPAHIIAGIPKPPGAYASVSPRSEKDTAVVFVHGFMGDPIDTWAYFHVYIDYAAEGTRAWWQSADLYFYGYHSGEWSVDEHAKGLLDFLDAVFPSPQVGLVEPLHELLQEFVRTKLGPFVSFAHPFVPAQSYKRLILVGHSLGCVLIRKAVLLRAAEYEYYKQHGPCPSGPRYGLLNANVRLFAPALFGAAPSRLLGVLANVILSVPVVREWVKPALKAWVIVRQLREDSGVLNELYTETKRMALEHRHTALVGDAVFGGDESVVERRSYLYDRLADTRPGHGHWSICKPTHDYRYPVKFVVEGHANDARAAPSE